MIHEVVILNIRPGRTAAFERDFITASAFIRSAEGSVTHELGRCLESSHRYVLMVQWDSLESHTVGFRQSANYAEWKRLLHHYYDPFPTVEHFEPLDLNE